MATLQPLKANAGGENCVAATIAECDFAFERCSLLVPCFRPW